MDRVSAVFFLCFFFIFAPFIAHAETYSVGANVAVKVDYFHFTDSNIGDLNAQDGVYFGIEAYKQLLLQNFFLGMEAGWAGTSGDVTGFIVGQQFVRTISIDTDINYVPIEFNAKYVIPFTNSLNLDFGAGLSINHMDIEVKAPILGSSTDDEWLWGGQFFAGVNYRLQNWLVGINAKYQLTEDFRFFGNNISTSADNLRLGMQIGYSF